MICKTEGIVLHTLKHSDSGAISHVFTKEYGRIPFFVRYSKRAGTKGNSAYFQPLYQVALEFYFKENRDIQNIKEVVPARILNKIPYDPYRSSIFLFLAETLYRSIPEKESNISLYNYISQFISMLDSTSESIANLHLAFLVGYSRFLGIAPTVNESLHNAVFDMQSGYFVKSIPLHGYYFDQTNTRIFLSFLNTSLEECHNISLTGDIRNRFLNYLLTYFSLHLPGIQNLKSLDVLTGMF